MEEDMDMDMEVEMFEVREIDLDYEFDAPRFFDFCGEESYMEAVAVERWFVSAKSYPPSPFVARLILREDNQLENVNFDSCRCPETLGVNMDSTGVNYEATDRRILVDLKNYNSGKALNPPLKLAGGLSFNDDMSTNKLKGRTKSGVKPNLPRSSTLMKPTASQLAKQNMPPRYQTTTFQNERSLHNSSMVECQAPALKRQKLEGGNLRKVGEVMQQTDRTRKVPKKDGIIDKPYVHAKLKLTIPKEPDLETASRAQRMRPKTNTEPEEVKIAPPRFKARPFNRKIFEGPSIPLPKKSVPGLPQFQEFHLKTLQRAIQHTSAVSSTSHDHNGGDKYLDKTSTATVPEKQNSEFMRKNTVDSMRQNDSSSLHQFKARVLNKKIFSSKGDLGVFRNNKRDPTVPKEFNFHTEKRIHPPTDLFSKLCLTSELKVHRPTSTNKQGSKENRMSTLPTENEKMHIKEKPSLFAGNQLNMRIVGIR